MRTIKTLTKESDIREGRVFSAKIKHTAEEICVPLHFHEFYEIEIFTQGHGTTVLNGETVPVKAGTVFFLTPLDYHQYSSAEEVTLLHLSFSGELYDEIFSDSEDADIVPCCDFSGSPRFACLQHLFHSLMYADTAEPELALLVLKAIASLLPKNGSGKSDSRIRSFYVQKATRYIQRNFRDSIGIDSVARHCDISTDYLRKIFLQCYACTPTDHIRKSRLSYAAKLLKTTCLSVSQIALDSGFQSIPSFNRAFKAAYGVSPVQYRKDEIK